MAKLAEQGWLNEAGRLTRVANAFHKPVDERLYAALGALCLYGKVVEQLVLAQQSAPDIAAHERERSPDEWERGLAGCDCASLAQHLVRGHRVATALPSVVVRPGDSIILMAEPETSQADADHIRVHLKGYIPGLAEVVVMGGVRQLAVYRPEPVDE